MRAKGGVGERGKQARARGFTLVETLIAIALLSVGVITLAALIPYSGKNDYRSRIDTTATFVATRELEQMLAQPFTAASFTDAPDDAATPATATVNLAPGGATLTAAGTIDFTQAQASVGAGYYRTYVIRPTAVANSVGVNSDSYDVRWKISLNANGVRTIVIAARQLALKSGATNLPANLRAVQMK